MSSAPPQLTVHTRPGCPFCFKLRLGLRLRRIRFTEVNIWEDAEAAAAVRAVANGNETVPTVHVAGRWLVNPSASLVSKLAKGRE
ncbi:MAG TPA: glutaredoxin domain-containing protein [Actinophytocola sp.]|jgi:mycoredoxin|nr:glutaredoxin domain-containing protein [Actinophytocola sp.]